MGTVDSETRFGLSIRARTGLGEKWAEASVPALSALAGPGTLLYYTARGGPATGRNAGDRSPVPLCPVTGVPVIGVRAPDKLGNWYPDPID